jgi:asparagine synthase (glutamine-hydrolysing)
LTRPFWTYCFEAIDPGFTRILVEHRHPFFDLRVLTYLLAIPPLPWCDNKEVLRSAMFGLLPESVRRRPKTPLRGDFRSELLCRDASAWVDRFEADSELARYVVRERIPPLSGERDSDAIWTNLRPLSLNFWLPRRGELIDAAKAIRREQGVGAGRPTPMPA